VYDPTHSQGLVSVGVDYDTAEFAVQSIRRWWKHTDKVSYPQAKTTLITAYGCGSKASRNRLWKVELQKLAVGTNNQLLRAINSRFPEPILLNFAYMRIMPKLCTLCLKHQ
jgi:hypothetical protein